MSKTSDVAALRQMRALVPLTLALAHLSIGCAKADIVGEWELIAPDSGLALGDVLTISGDGTWAETGFPKLTGSYEWQGGELVLRIETLGGQTREEAAESVKSNELLRKAHEKSLAELDSQRVFVLDEIDGSQVLRQSDPGAGRAERRYRKKGR